MKISNEITEISNFLKRYNPSKIILFGSSARGDGDEYSDIDICMIVDNKPVQGIAELKVQISLEMLSLNIVRAVDLIIVTNEDFLKQKDSKYSVYKEINRDAIVLYKRK